MILHRQLVAGAAVESSGLIAGIILALLIATALCIGDQIEWRNAPAFKAVVLFVTVALTRVIIARTLIERCLLASLKAKRANPPNQNLAMKFAAEWSQSIGIGLVIAAAAAYFMLTREMSWGFLNTNWGVSITTGIIASTATKWTMVCNPTFWVIGGSVRVSESGDLGG